MKLSEKTWYAVLWWILFLPVGLYLSLRYHKRSRKPIAIIGGIFIFFCVLVAVIPDSDKPESVNGQPITSGTTGEVDFGSYAKDGTFTLNWKTGDVYAGEVKDGVISGQGKATLADGTVLEGEFQDNIFLTGTCLIQNKTGTYKWNVNEKALSKNVWAEFADGSVYIGDYSKNNLNGTGKMTYKNGDKYEGSFVDGKKSGEGTYTWSDGAIYYGDWKNDQMNGVGEYDYGPNINALKLLGVFEANQPSGKCDFYITEAKHYKTTWANGTCTKVEEA
jgi:hypothetical protein